MRGVSGSKPSVTERMTPGLVDRAPVTMPSCHRWSTADSATFTSATVLSSATRRVWGLGQHLGTVKTTVLANAETRLLDAIQGKRRFPTNRVETNVQCVAII